MKSVRYLMLPLLFISACSSKVPATPEPAKAEAPVKIQITPDMTATEIAKGAFVIDHHFPTADANSMIVEMSPTDLLMIDTPWTGTATRELLKWSQEKFGKRKITVINTHSHMDRVAGNFVYLENGADIYASDLTNQYVKKNKPTELKDLAKKTKNPVLKAEYKSMKLIEANHTFPLKEGKTLDFGDNKAEIFYPGHGHTKDNVVVYLPENKILFGGCFIVGMPKLGYIKEADLRAWPKALDTLSRFDMKYVIPGHYGDTYSPTLIQHTKDLVH